MLFLTSHFLSPKRQSLNLTYINPQRKTLYSDFYYILPAVVVNHWFVININIFRTLRQLFGQYHPMMLCGLLVIVHIFNIYCLNNKQSDRNSAIGIIIILNQIPSIF